LLENILYIFQMNKMKTFNEVCCEDLDFMIVLLIMWRKSIIIGTYFMWNISVMFLCVSYQLCWSEWRIWWWQCFWTRDVRFGPKVSQIGSPSQNILKSELKKFQICPIWGQSDQLWGQNWALCCGLMENCNLCVNKIRICCVWPLNSDVC